MQCLKIKYIAGSKYSTQTLGIIIMKPLKYFIYISRSIDLASAITTSGIIMVLKSANNNNQL